MTPRYDIFVRSEAVDSLRGIRGAARGSIYRFIGSLAGDPFQEGDHPIKDSTGRVIFIKVVGSQAVLFWVDHAAKEVKVLQIRGADGN